MYVRRYARTTHGAFTKSPKSFDMVNSDVDTIEVSRLENNNPISRLVFVTISLSNCHCLQRSWTHDRIRMT
jgi:hypothetical protein